MIGYIVDEVGVRSRLRSRVTSLQFPMVAERVKYLFDKIYRTNA